jgi:hypothetical protein
MALPRPTLLAVLGALLSLISFTAMRTIGTQSVDGLTLPDISTQGVTGGSSSTAKKDDNPAPPPPEPRVEDVPRAVSNALADGKVVVLLFVEHDAADDQATARHFSALSQLGGVETFRAGISEVGRYAGIVANLGISQAPSIVIVRPDLRAVPPIEGYVESQYLLQRVRDQL